LLNAIDGISSQASTADPVTPSALSLMMQEGSVLFASTNHPDKLDPALRRPGRFDVKISFSHATTTQATTIFQHFYALVSESQPSLELGSRLK
jgi:SpoVK/Ycf46/Vps4 family AAA+-type ATPase